MSAIESSDTTERAKTTVGEALARFFEAGGFDQSSYADDWVAIPVGPLTVRFPNTEDRKKVLPLHDVHHALTGYDSSNIGEAEEGAWELGSGCMGEPLAWFLNSAAMVPGVFLAPQRTLRAFARGRRSDNLYSRRPELEPLLAQDLEETRGQLRIPRAEDIEVGLDDVAAFAAAAALALAATPLGVGIFTATTLAGMARA